MLYAPSLFQISTTDKTFRIVVIGLLLMLTCYSTSSIGYQLQASEEVQQSLLKKLQLFATKSDMQVPSDLQDTAALMKVAQQVAQSRADLDLSPDESKVAFQLMQSFSGQRNQTVKQHTQLEAGATRLTQEQLMKQRIEAMAAGGGNQTASKVLALLNQQQLPQEIEHTSTSRAKLQQRVIVKSDDKEKPQVQDPTALIQQMAQKTSAAAGKIREQHATDTYANMSVTEKLEVILDSEKAPELSKVIELVSQGADINNVSEYTRQNTLHLAAKHGHLEIVKYLVQKGANKQLHNHKGYTPGQLAEGLKHYQISALLDPNKLHSIPREYRTRVLLVGNWQNVDDPNDIMRFRKDLTALMKTQSGYAEKVWDPSVINRNKDYNLVVISSKRAATTISDSGVISTGSSGSQSSTRMLYGFEDEYLVIPTKGSFNRYKKVAIEGDDMYRKQRDQDEFINLSRQTNYPLDKI